MPLGYSLSRVVRSSLLASLVLGASAALEPLPQAAQTAAEPVPIFASGPLPLRGPIPDQRQGETAELCAVNLGSGPAELGLELRDATKVERVLNASKIALDAGKGACLTYTERAQESRRVVGIVEALVGTNWRLVSRSITATAVIRDGTSNTILIAETSPKLATFPLEFSRAGHEPGDVASGTGDRREQRPLPVPVNVAGPLPVDGPGSVSAADTVEVCATNVAITNVEYTLTIHDADTGEVLVSLRGALGPGEGNCLPYMDAQISRRVIAIVSPVSGASGGWGKDWAIKQRSLLSLTLIKDGTSNTIFVAEMYPRLAFLPAVQ